MTQTARHSRSREKLPGGCARLRRWTNGILLDMVPRLRHFDAMRPSWHRPNLLGESAIVTVLMLLASSSHAQGRRPSDSTVFRAGIDVVSLNVSVRDSSNKPIPPLSPDDFVVFEDNRPQTVVSVSRQRVPLGLALLLDTSASMERNLALAQAAAAEFVERMALEDQASVIDFDSRVKVLQPFTSDIQALRSAISRTSADGSTSLFNAVYIALKDLERARASTPEEIRRQAIVVLSDGDDTSSLLAFDDVLDLAKRSHTSIYTIGIREKNPSGQPMAASGDFVLRRLAAETGGLAYFPLGADDLPRIYREIADELTSQYLVAYVPANVARDGQWRRLAVRVNRPNCSARTKAGYFAPTR
jgi:Ca-activated chloride channel family protein